jgi:hypothetical protein
MLIENLLGKWQFWWWTRERERDQEREKEGVKRSTIFHKSFQTQIDNLMESTDNADGNGKE